VCLFESFKANITKKNTKQSLDLLKLPSNLKIDFRTFYSLSAPPQLSQPQRLRETRASRRLHPVSQRVLFSPSGLLAPGPADQGISNVGRGQRGGMAAMGDGAAGVAAIKVRIFITSVYLAWERMNERMGGWLQ
jgi:hypothetical protein